MGSMLKRIGKKRFEREKYSNISVEELEKMKNRVLEIKEEIEMLSKEVSFDNVKKVSNLSKEFAKITRELQIYEKYAKKRDDSKCIQS